MRTSYNGVKLYNSKRKDCNYCLNKIFSYSGGGACMLCINFTTCIWSDCIVNRPRAHRQFISNSTPGSLWNDTAKCDWHRMLTWLIHVLYSNRDSGLWSEGTSWNEYSCMWEIKRFWHTFLLRFQMLSISNRWRRHECWHNKSFWHTSKWWGLSIICWPLIILQFWNWA